MANRRNMEKPFYAKWWFMLIIILFFVVIVSNIFNQQEVSNKPGVFETTSSINRAVTERPTITGEELKIGDVVFKVNSVSQTTEISAGNGYFRYAPEAAGAVYILANVTVRNEGNEMINTDSSFFQLKTGETTYSPSSIFVADEKFFAYDGINPGLSLSGNVIFEVPPGLTGLELHVQTGFWGTETGFIRVN